ncbi:uncharacterized protein (DUF1330 family) [Dyadobacter arcticus]|uniref:Uncharacterized protein (DUF1330 family) n=1 Tax=Dyadobacter arcticus TaxID=1078754 RepID=A0ABX0UQ76_9BACT|nr:uncharacterized protein (DUF1330 family) [Dyadobacter arcticus]
MPKGYWIANSDVRDMEGLMRIGIVTVSKF